MRKYKVLKEFIDPDFTWFKPDEIFTPTSNIMIDALKSAKFIEEIEEPTRWRAKEGGYFFTLDVDLNPDASIEMRRSYEGDLYELGNYFRSRETANLVSKAQKLFFEWIHLEYDPLAGKWSEVETAIENAREAVLKDNEGIN